MRILLSGILCLAFASCATRPPGGAQPVLALRPQSSTRDFCGPTTLASVLAFHGVDLPEDQIAAQIFSPSARGVLITDLARVAREQGLVSRVQSGTMTELKQSIESGNPPIVLLDLGVGSRRVPHFTALTGITPEGVFAIGTSATDDFIPIRLFNRQWNQTENQFLVLSRQS
jgi:predicted double-glycine peptidase